MDFRNQYRSMNERIAPDKALVADTLARMARGEKPRHRPRRLRRVLTIAVAAAVAIGCMTPALAANVPGVYQALYTISPAVAQFLVPVNLSCEREGVRLEVTDAYLQGHTACISFTMQDIQGSRLTNAHATLSDWYLDSMGLGSSRCRLVSYDAQTRTAAFFAEFSNPGQTFDPESMQTFRVSELFCGGAQAEDAPLAVPLSDVPVDPPVQIHEISSGTLDETGQCPTQYAFLMSQQPLWQSADGVFSLSAAGYREGQLHLQLCTDESRVASASGLLELCDADGQTVAAAAAYSWTEGEHHYTETLYDIPCNALPGCSLTLDSSIYETVIPGNWQVTFRLEKE